MIISTSITKIDQTVSILGYVFQVKDLGSMTKFLGINIIQDPDGIRIDQCDEIETPCDGMNMTNCKGSNTPIADDNLIDSDTNNSCAEQGSALYRSAVGTLLYIANMTRPDLQYTLSRLSRHVRQPSQNAFLSLKNLMRYFSRTKSATLFFPRQEICGLTTSLDSSWENIHSSKGTSGIFFFINGSIIAWWSEKKTVKAQSICKAEYTALTTQAIAAQWLCLLYEELFKTNSESIPTEIDNTSVIKIASTDKINARNRHFLMQQSIVRESNKSGYIKLKYAPSDFCIADRLTQVLKSFKTW